MTRIILQARVHAIGALLCTAALCAAAPAQAAPLYSARLLESAAPDPGGEEPAPRNTTARSINDTGQVAGGSAAGPTLWRSAAASGQTLVDPRTSEQINGWPGVTAINASGMVVGGGGGRVGGGLVWRDGAGIFVPGFYEARGVNDAGLVVGEGFVDYTSRPAQWIDGSFSLLQMLDDGLYGSANAVNNLGVIAGWRDAGGQIVTLWENGVPRSLDIEGVATDINDRGQVAGYRDTQGFVWSMGTLSMLDPLAGGLARVSALNDSGLVVGWSDLGDAATATLWENGQAVDLNSLLAPGALGADWRLREAYDINDLGWIVGDAVNLLDGQVRGFVLTPLADHAVPEPHGLGLALAGLLALGIARRRR